MSTKGLTETLQETLAHFDGSATPRTTPEVAEELGLERRTTYARLERLVEQDKLATKKVGANARVWWRPPDVGPSSEGESGATDGSRTEDGQEGHGHETEKAFAESILENQRDVIYAFDKSGQFLRWNDQMRAVTGYDDEDIEQMQPIDFIAPPDVEKVSEAIARVFDGESVTVEGRVLTADGETIPYEFSGMPLTNENGEVMGLTGIGRDIRDRKAKERQLKRQHDDLESELNEVFERVDDGFFALDSELRFTHLNDWAAELLDIDEADVIDQYVWDVLEPGLQGREAFAKAMESQSQVSVEQFYEPLNAWFETHIYPSESGLSVYFREITDRKERQQELERFKHAVEAFGHAIYMTDDDGRITYVNDEFERMTGYSVAEAVGETPAILRSGHRSDDYDSDLWETISDGAVWEGELIAERKNGERYDAEEMVAPVMADDGSVDQIVTIQKDICERKERERELVRYETLFEESKDVNVVVDQNGAFQYVTPSAANVFGYDPDELVGDVGFEYIHPDDRDYALTEFAKMIEDPDYEPTIEFRFEHADGSWIVLEAVARNLLFDPDIKGIVIYTRDITDRKEREEELVHQREQLAALNNLNSVVRDITEAVIEQSTREEIEDIVCRRLADTESYLFAWTGEADPKTQTVCVRTEAGCEGYPDGISITVDPDDERSNGPTGRALLSGEMQATTDIEVDARHDPWRDRIKEHGVRSSAAIPIAHEGTTYGVLNVYADRPNAFEGEEAAMIRQLGEIVGYAIAAVDRKQALMSDEVVELGFQIEDIFTTFGIDPVDGATVRLDHTVQVEADDYLIFGRTTPSGVDVLEQMVETIPFYEAVTIRDDDEGKQFELLLSEPPVLSAIAAAGGSIADALIEDGNYRLTVHLPTSADVQQMVDVVTDTYSNVSLLKRQQLTTRDDSDGLDAASLSSVLTDRQRVTLETAYHTGFFEWPRDVSGKDVAETLDIAAPTFHQHLRKAERKLLDNVFDTADDESE